MLSITETEAKDQLGHLLDNVAESHSPICIIGKKNSAFLVSEEDWKSLQETIYLLSIPGIRESIRQGLETPIEDCSSKFAGWVKL